MTIDTLDAVQLGDTTQWIRIRGEDAANPVLLLVQQGPGLPMINEVRRFEPSRTGEGVHRRLLGPTRLRSLAAERR
jgi:hypothetical protein